MKKEIKTELTKEKILVEAMAEFGSKGYTGASLNSICSTGIPKGLLYHNYKNKDDLYLACIKRSLERLTDYLKNQTPGFELHEYMDARLQFFNQNKQEAHLFFESLLQPPAMLKEQIEELRKDFDTLNCSLYHNLLSKIQLRDHVTQEEAMQYFMLMQNMFNGYFSSPALCRLSFPDVIRVHEERISKLLDFMIYGIAERRIPQ